VTDPSDSFTPVMNNKAPGNYIRRLYQISVAIFLQEAEGYGITPVQFAALQYVEREPDIDQRTLAQAIGTDASTTTGVIDRLESRGLLERLPSPGDRRVRLLRTTDAGRQLLADVMPAVMRAQEIMIEPLSSTERAEFLRMLDILVTKNNYLSRAPQKRTS